MSEPSNISVPKKYWLISGLALAWYLFGLFVYYSSVTTTPDKYKEWISSGTYSQGYVDYMQTIPAWATAAFAIATTAGVLACVCLLLRRSWAVPLFVLSMLGSLAMYAYAYLMSGRAGDLPSTDQFISLLVVCVTAFMIWFSRKKKAKGILK